MADDLEDMFVEAAAEDNSLDGDDLILTGLDDGPVDNPDDGADPEIVENQDDEPIIDDPDTDDVPPVDDNDLFDWEAFADQKVAFKDNGEDIVVPLAELKNGYLRHQDYSRKTAEIAEDKRFAVWGKDVQSAFKSDPEGTLQGFAQALGFQVVRPGQVAPAQGAPTVQPDYSEYEPEVAAVLQRLDEQEARHQQELAQIRSQTDRFEQERLRGEVKAEMQSLKTHYGDDLDELAALQLAATENLPLGLAAKLVVADRREANGQINAQVSLTAAEAASRRQAALDAQRAKQKRQAAGTAKGSFDAVGSDVDSGDFNDIGELFAIEMARTG